ncbi:MAG TPA: hypothetical protein VHX38_15390 [Pseudonocardiaceae bacterium]|nr:hypothetical protein [Pseudonocardiaceae bacterium]
MADPTEEPGGELPPTLRHQMDDWDEEVRDQQLAFVDAAEDLEAQARDIQLQLETAEEVRRPNLLMHLDLVTKLAANVRTMAKIPFPIPDEGVTVREEPTAPDGLVYVDPEEAATLFPRVVNAEDDTDDDEDDTDDDQDTESGRG